MKVQGITERSHTQFNQQSQMVRINNFPARKNTAFGMLVEFAPKDFCKELSDINKPVQAALFTICKKIINKLDINEIFKNTLYETAYNILQKSFGNNFCENNLNSIKQFKLLGFSEVFSDFNKFTLCLSLHRNKSDMTYLLPSAKLFKDVFENFDYTTSAFDQKQPKVKIDLPFDNKKYAALFTPNIFNFVIEKVISEALNVNPHMQNLLTTTENVANRLNIPIKINETSNSTYLNLGPAWGTKKYDKACESFTKEVILG